MAFFRASQLSVLGLLAISRWAVDAAKCAALKTFTLPEMTHGGLESAGGLAASDAFIAADITGFGDFSEEKK